MSCPCENSDKAVIENYLTCTTCGLCTDYAPTYVISYNNPRAHYRRCYYSRIKRFQKKMREMKSELIGKHSEDILYMYGRLEFAWNCSKEKNENISSVRKS